MDGGRFITLPLVVTRDPTPGKRNMGMYRMQVYDGQTTGMHWQRQKVAAEHFRERLRMAAGATATGSRRPRVSTSWRKPPEAQSDWRRQHARCRQCAARDDNRSARRAHGSCGRHRHRSGDDFLRDRARATRGRGVHHRRFSSAGAGRAGASAKRSICRCPAHAEIVLEGYVELGELRAEGPFGDHTGFYTLPDDYPVFHITCITHRKDPIYASTIVGKPPMEDAWMGLAVERIFLPLIRLSAPEIVDIHLPPEAVFHNLMIVSIRKSYAGPGAQGDERHLVAGPGHVHQVHHRGG